MRISLTLLLYILTGSVFSQNQQPVTGPGGNTYPHAGFTKTKYGSSITDCYWLYEPQNPKPDSAPVVVFWHGTSAQTEIDSLPNGQELFLQHICKKGYTIIFPLYQYGGQTLPAAQQLTNGGAVVNMALAELNTASNHVKPTHNADGDLEFGAVGISRGGGMVLNVATYHDTLNLPSFKALCAFVPGAGLSMSGIDTSTKVLVVNGQDNTLNYAESFEAYDSLYRIPCYNKHLLQVNSDHNGLPDLSAEHNFAGSGKSWDDSTALNYLDFYGSWKYSVALLNCTFYGQDCDYCLGTDTLITYMGMRSNGTPVSPASIMDSCGISTALPELNIEERLNLYPNPATKELLIQNLVGEWRVSIYSAIGTEVLSLTNINGQPINISQLPAGSYIIQATWEGQRLVSRFIKTNN
ncbi:MAG: T9SS type A sorting domain-containing protein [Chitinophagales bacterium]